MATRYVQNVPQVGTMCPACGQGPIVQGQYSPWCGICRTGFKKSQYPPRGAAPAPQQGAQSVPTPAPPVYPAPGPNNNPENVVRGLGVLRGDIQKMQAEIVDKLDCLMNMMMPSDVKGGEPPATATPVPQVPTTTPEDIPIINENGAPTREQVKEGMTF